MITAIGVVIGIIVVFFIIKKFIKLAIIIAVIYLIVQAGLFGLFAHALGNFHVQAATHPIATTAIPPTQVRKAVPTKHSTKVNPTIANEIGADLAHAAIQYVATGKVNQSALTAQIEKQLQGVSPKQAMNELSGVRGESSKLGINVNQLVSS